MCSAKSLTIHLVSRLFILLKTHRLSCGVHSTAGHTPALPPELIDPGAGT